MSFIALPQVLEPASTTGENVKPDSEGGVSDPTAEDVAVDASEGDEHQKQDPTASTISSDKQASCFPARSIRFY